MLTIVYLHKNY